MNNIIFTKNAPKPIGPYVQAIQTQNILIISGQIAINNTSGTIPDNISEQTYLVLSNIKSIILAASFEIKDIIKMTIFTTNLKKIDIINEIYTKFFIDNKSEFPTRSCIEVQALPKNAKIEIETMALKR